jgi:hypothetical protein
MAPQEGRRRFAAGQHHPDAGILVRTQLDIVVADDTLVRQLPCQVGRDGFTIKIEHAEEYQALLLQHLPDGLE